MKQKTWGLRLAYWLALAALIGVTVWECCTARRFSYFVVFCLAGALLMTVFYFVMMQRLRKREDGTICREKSFFRAEPEAWNLFARGFEKWAAGETEGAVPLFEQAKKAAGTPRAQGRCALYLGNCQMALKQDEQAEANLKEAVEKNPRDDGAWAVLFTVLWEQDRFEEAEQVCETGLKNCPGSPLLQEKQGQAAFFMGRYQTALNAYLAALKEWPDSPQITANCAMIYAALGDEKNAVKLAHRSRKLGNAVAGRLDQKIQFMLEDARLRRQMDEADPPEHPVE